MEISSKDLSLNEKLKILADAAKYDVACTSSGSSRRGKKGMLGNTEAAGICHSFSSDGRVIFKLWNRKESDLYDGIDVSGDLSASYKVPF